MSNDNGGAVAIRQDASPILDERKIALLRESIANGAPELEFDLFVAVCNRTGLDPFARQIYFIERGKKWSWQTSIDGYRLIADRTHAYAGSDEPVYTEKDGKPVTATVTVWKLVQGQRCPFTATVRWDEYNQANSPTWNRMPFLMLAKCAESLALRKAFPAELSGLYTRDEMMQADAPEVYADEVIDAETGVIVEHDNRPMNAIEEEFYAAVLASKSRAEVNRHVAEMKAKQITHPTLSLAVEARRQELSEAVQRELVGAAAGEPGNDRHSR